MAISSKTELFINDQSFKRMTFQNFVTLSQCVNICKKLFDNKKKVLILFHHFYCNAFCFSICLNCFIITFYMLLCCKFEFAQRNYSIVPVVFI